MHSSMNKWNVEERKEAENKGKATMILITCEMNVRVCMFVLEKSKSTLQFVKSEKNSIYLLSCLLLGKKNKNQINFKDLKLMVE